MWTILRRLLVCFNCSEYKKVPKDIPLDENIPQPLTEYPCKHRDLYPELSRDRVLNLVQSLISKGKNTQYVLYRNGTVFICPAVDDPILVGGKVLKKITDKKEIHYVAQQADPNLVVFLFGKQEGFTSIFVIIDPEPLGMLGTPHQLLQDVARMLLMWDRTDHEVIVSGAVS